ncbi:hypothetical protein AYO21_11512 [Fonsecaea monophora]|uniref:Uncharacterized protein n=1 Tax=Fonsecaea monophora TaxID=254056 RepID=A0A177ETE5_9EURO|nr:hypothetical protein AYO21_11512 [Fonsecaea monophora]OAG34332.1 hypothetical protein AYO21_11512 [Fonsecaea monophora]
MSFYDNSELSVISTMMNISAAEDRSVVDLQKIFHVSHNHSSMCRKSPVERVRLRVQLAGDVQIQQHQLDRPHDLSGGGGGGVQITTRTDLSLLYSGGGAETSLFAIEMQMYQILTVRSLEQLANKRQWSRIRPEISPLPGPPPKEGGTSGPKLAICSRNNFPKRIRFWQYNFFSFSPYISQTAYPSHSYATGTLVSAIWRLPSSAIIVQRLVVVLGLARSGHSVKDATAITDSSLGIPDKTALPKAHDAVRNLVNPPEDFKTSVLCGLDPANIMECAQTALSFWTYQKAQEL